MYESLMIELVNVHMIQSGKEMKENKNKKII